MSVLELNNIKVFNLSSGKSLSQFIEDSIKTKKSLRYNTDYRNRLELIQDFEFPTASTRVHTSSDGSYIISSGVYPPQLRIFETSDLSMKVQRNFDSEIIQFSVLTSDYKKVAALLADRSIELHAQYGKHYSTRIPRFGRDLVYNPFSAELLIVGATNETYRLNLELGRFMAPLESKVCSELNVCGIVDELVWVLAEGGVDGMVECWDLRQKERAALVDCKQGEVTALGFCGLQMTVGHSNGIVNMYDVRFPRVLFEVVHKNRLQIKAAKFHDGFLLTSDCKALKISKAHNGEMVTTVEMESNVNDIETIKGSGLVFVANESQRVGTFYIPTLGPAPKWCSFVDALNDEIEEQKVSIYDNKQFVTMEELEKINGIELIGSEMLQGYMHGYLIDSKLYYKLKALAEPFDYQEYRKERIAKKLEERTGERITIKKKLPKINKTFAAEMLNEDPKGKHAKNKEILEDDRFKDMFNDKEFEINRESDDYKRLNYRKKNVMLEEEELDESEEEEEEIVPKIKKRKREEGELVEDVEEGDGELAFKERFDIKEKVGGKVKKVRKEKTSKVLKGKQDLEGRRTAVSMQNMLKAKSKNYR